MHSTFRLNKSKFINTDKLRIASKPENKQEAYFSEERSNIQYFKIEFLDKGKTNFEDSFLFQRNINVSPKFKDSKGQHFTFQTNSEV